MSRRRKFGVIMFLGWDRCFFSFLYEKGLEILFLLSENIIKLSVYFQSFPKIHYCFSLRNVYLRPCIIFDRRFQSFFIKSQAFSFLFGGKTTYITWKILLLVRSLWGSSLLYCCQSSVYSIFL